MSSRAAHTLGWLMVASVLTTGALARADEAPRLQSGGDPRLQSGGDRDQARADFVRGTTLVSQAKWGDALAAFERASTVAPHPITTYNIGACERALGRYQRARAALVRARAQRDAAGLGLPSELEQKAGSFIEEIDRLSHVLELDVQSRDVHVTTDGRPLHAGAGAGGELEAGVRDPGPGEGVPVGISRLRIDPGVHALVFTSPGHEEVRIERQLDPGATTRLAVSLRALPSTLRIRASEPSASIALDGVVKGFAPLVLAPRSGDHVVRVTKAGFDDYEAKLSLKPGQGVALDAELSPHRVPITKRWWFWAAAGTLVAGAAVGTYLLTRPEPTPAQPSGGSLGWNVNLDY